MFKRILVPTDGSEFAQRAFLNALAVAEKFGAEIQLLYVATTRDGALEATKTSNDSCEADPSFIDEAGQAVMRATRARAGTISVKVLEKMVTGKPAEMILQEIRRDFDLVVMGTRGHSRLVGAVLGSVTQKVLVEAECPVLVVK